MDGIDPDACDPPLYTVIDPTALDQLIESPGIFRRGSCRFATADTM
ncbi:HalOD1 output domain-containing protein [Natrialbaceae archaeon A-CW1-1]